MKLLITSLLLTAGIIFSFNVPAYVASSNFQFVQDFEQIVGWAANNNISGITSKDAYSGSCSYLLNSEHNTSSFFEVPMKAITGERTLTRARVNAKAKWFKGDDAKLFLICDLRKTETTPGQWGRVEMHQQLKKGQWTDLHFEMAINSNYSPDALIGFYFEGAPENDIFIDDFEVEFF